MQVVLKFILAIAIGGTVGYFISAFLQIVAVKTGVEPSFITQILIYYISAFCGLLGATIMNGFSGKGFKVIQN